MRAWLYPVSTRGTHRFRDATGRSRVVTFEAIREAIADGGFPGRAEWPCVQNATNAREGDELFLYSGAVGIFAAGRVVGAQETARRTPGGARIWMLTWRPDLSRSRRLLANPVPAPDVRRHVHPRVTIRDFTAGAKALRRRLR